MKKICALVLTLCLALACLSMAAAEDKTYHVGVLQLVQHVALDAATQGFQDALTEKLGDKIVIDVKTRPARASTAPQLPMTLWLPIWT